MTGRLFDLSYTPVTDVGLRHPDVTDNDVTLAGEVLGGIFLYSTRARTSTTMPRSSPSPTGWPAGSSPRASWSATSRKGLMEHDDVVTLFHEFGHLVHHILAGRALWSRFSGVATEWDFVEAPSQLLEEWAWDASVLQTFARNASGEPIPADLVAAMKRADDFGKGYHARTQMFYAAMSYWLHTDRPSDLTAAFGVLAGQVLDVGLRPRHPHVRRVGHLEGYSSGYYTYMWSLVIAKDLFSAFYIDLLFAPEVAHRYRDLILASGRYEKTPPTSSKTSSAAPTPSTRTPPGWRGRSREGIPG